MNWDAIGAIAELLASITVIITLIYLATQVRQASTNSRIAGARDARATQNTWLRSVRGDPAVHALYRRGLKDRLALSSDERGRFDLLLLELFNDLDSHYHQFLSSTINEDQWQALMRTFRVITDAPGGYASWQKQKTFCSDAFRHYMDELYIERNKLD